ncbi:hypothetical protein [uncultured Cohaesibacter sp.]|uniref:hypothetical protein n=1 Tax=uncultured Cohaesibacter sp. TaxID=1002546 RepID=UPI00374A9498
MAAEKTALPLSKSGKIAYLVGSAHPENQIRCCKDPSGSAFLALPDANKQEFA